MKHDSGELLSTVDSSQAISAARAYKTLLVPFDAAGRSTRNVEVACRLAKHFDAHVVGLFVQPTFYIPPDLSLCGSTASLAQIEDKVCESAQAARALFDDITNRILGRSAEWRTARGDAASVVMTHARYADLVIINQNDPEAGAASGFDDTLVLSVGRPVLFVPNAGDLSGVRTRALVCWNASHEAARALTDALPLLQRARKVTVLSIDAQASETGHGQQPGADIALFLARHGVKADVMQTVAGGLDPGDAILSHAADEGVDLIVMGAYGHARLQETIFGGATHTILRSMTVPVLMSH